MSDALSFAELDSQQVELLPARTVLSLFAPVTPKPGGNGVPGTGSGGGSGGSGGKAIGGLNFTDMFSGMGFGGTGTATGGSATGGDGGHGGNTP